MYSKEMVPSNEYNLVKEDFLIEDCIVRIAEGNKEGLAELYEITKASVYGFSLSILKNEADAEDVMQEVYVKIFNNAEKYKKQGKPLAWILTITKNLAFMKLRVRKSEREITELDNVGAKLEKLSEDKMILNFALKCLTDEERNIVILHANSGFKHREIAKLLDIPLSTVLSKYNRAIKKLKKEILKEGM